MSCEAVKTFLEQENQKEKNQEAQYRYEVLSHYNLGAEVIFDGNGNKDDYPLLRQDMYGETIRFNYICDVFDDDFRKIQLIYEKEMKSVVKNDGAEKTLNICATILVILGILTLVVMFFVANSERYFNWGLFGIGIGAFFTCLIENAFAKVILNISNKLNK